MNIMRLAGGLRKLRDPINSVMSASPAESCRGVAEIDVDGIADCGDRVSEERPA